MADGNELDDDLDIDSVEYETETDGITAFALPINGFVTEQQREWAERIGRKVVTLERENRTLKSQVDNANRLANDTNAVVSEIIYDQSEEMGDGVENDDPLSAPSKPVVASRLGTFEISWDGVDFEEEPMPSAFQFLNVYAAKTADLPENPDWDLVQPEDDGEPEVPDPDDPIYDIPDDGPEVPAPDPEPAQITEWPPVPIGIIQATNSNMNVVLSDLVYNEEYTVWFMAVDTNGNLSPASERTTASVQPLVNTDIIGRVIDGANIELESLNEELFDAQFQGKIDDLEAAASSNSVLVRNYSFEHGGDWKPLWGGFVRSEQPDAPSGSWVYGGTGAVNSTIAQEIEVIPGNAYRLRFYSRSVLGTVGATINTGDINGTIDEWVTRAVWMRSDDHPDWEEISLEFTVDPSWDTDKVIVVFLLYAELPSAVTQIDRVALDNLSIPVEVNGNFFAEVDPSQDGTAVGQLWYKRDSSGKILAMWEWSGTAWNPLEMTNAVIANLDAGKITSGFIDADRIEANTIHGNKIVAGSIQGDKIAANTITGNNIVGNTITGDKIAALTIEAGNIKANAITTDKVDAGAITGVKISATAIDGKVITGATVRTNFIGQRIQLDPTGLKSFNTSNTMTAHLSAAAGSLSLTGSLIATDADIASVYSTGRTAQLADGRVYLRDAYEKVTNSPEAYLTTSGFYGQRNSWFDFQANAATENVANTGLRLTSNGANGIQITASQGNINLNPASVGVGGSIQSSRPGTILYQSSGIFLNQNQTVNLSESVNSQLSGIVLIWSAYSDGSASNSSWNHVFVSKRQTGSHAGQGVICNIYGWKTPVWKYAYISNSSITGHADNSASPNNTQVLRYVIGV